MSSVDNSESTSSTGDETSSILSDSISTAQELNVEHENKKLKHRGDHHFLCTLNNWTKPEEDALCAFPLQYISYGREVGKQNGVPHLQIHLYSKEALTLSALNSRLHRVGLSRISNLQVAKSPLNSIEYTQKDGNYKEIGSRPRLAGCKSSGRTSLSTPNWFEARKQALTGGVLAVTDAGMAVRYAGNFQKIYELNKASLSKRTTDIVDLYPWQQDVVDYVNGPVNKREIYWVIDKKGGKGKTALTDYLVVNLAAIPIAPGKVVDMAYLVPSEGAKIFVFDFTREIEDRVQYGFIENLKNGRIQSTKYMCNWKCFPSPHVIVFSNWPPDYSKMSEDRWKVIDLI